MKVIYEQCGKVFYRQPSRIRRQTFCSLGCWYQYAVGKNNEELYGSHKALLMKQAHIKAILGKKRINHSIKMQGVNNPMFGQHHTSETKKLMSEKRRGKPGYCYHQFDLTYSRKPLRERLHRLSYEEWLTKIIEAQKRKPTKLEGRIIAIMKEYRLPFDYVGDGKVFIAGKCPDFINTNGKKQLIEVFGDYWHKPEDEEMRRSHFAQYGFSTLVLWEKELKVLSSSQVAEKIMAWEV